MFLIIFVSILLVGLIAILFGVSKAFRFLYRKAGLIPVVLLLGALVAWPIVAWNRYAYRHALSLVPAELAVTSIRFEATEFMGFGPGGSEAGLLVYALPDAVARRVEREGVAYLASLQQSSESREGHKEYWEWQHTPAVWHGFPVGPELCVYDACSDIPADVRRQVNAIAASADNYYAHGRNATIMLSPRERTVIVHYSK